MVRLKYNQQKKDHCKEILCIIIVIPFCFFILYFFNPFSFVKRHTYCKLTECCTDAYIIADFKSLDEKLETKLYGQHLAKKIVLSALQTHFTEKNPEKALTLSFHGPPGIGKNYLIGFIKESMYKLGGKSNYFHQFTANVNFPLASKADEYRANLQNWIQGNVSQCERSMFVFDEVDKMPLNILNAIKPMIDYNDLVNKIDYRKTVFIFISNTGSEIINNHFIQLWEKGIKREDIELNHFEKLIRQGAFNEKGGFQYSDAVKHNLIDLYIPFLPLEKQHVIRCIKDQFSIRGVYSPSDKMIEEVLKVVGWGPLPINLYSKSGCKRLTQQVPLAMKKFNIKSINKHVEL